MKARWIGLGIGAALCLAACGDAARPAEVEGSASPADATAGAGIVAAATAPYARAVRAPASEGKLGFAAAVMLAEQAMSNDQPDSVLAGYRARH